MSKETRTVSLLWGNYKCISFTNVDPDESGVEVYTDYNRSLGSILGINIPDSEDEEECESFDKEVEDWVLDNGH